MPTFTRPNAQDFDAVSNITMQHSHELIYVDVPLSMMICDDIYGDDIW